MTMRRFKLVRLVGGFPQYIDYVGPFDGWSREWSIAVRYATRRAA